MRISVLGLGGMGAPMARNLIEVGHDVTLYNPFSAPVIETIANGARVATSIPDAVRDAHVALTIVLDDETEIALTYGKDGLLTHLGSGAIHLCMSPIGVETSRNLAAAHAGAGQGYVAAPVFGRLGAAATRQLWILAGGPEHQVNRCLTILESLGQGITRVGSRAEHAHALSLGGKLLTTVMVEGLSEVMAFGEKAGMAPADYLRLLNTALFKSPLMDSYGGLIVRRMYDPTHLTLDSALKQTQLMIDASEELDSIIPMADLIYQRLEEAEVHGWGALDLSVLSRSCRIAAGLEDDEGVKKKLTNMKTEAQPPRFIGQLREGGAEVLLDLRETAQFEIIKGDVWAWVKGVCYCTSWKRFSEIENTFKDTRFQRVHRHLLLNQEQKYTHQTTPDQFENINIDKISSPFNHGLKETINTSGYDKNGLIHSFHLATHFELENKIVWAWIQGKRVRTPWGNLSEIQSALSQVILLKIQGNILLHPEAVISIQPAFGGRTKVKVAGNMELTVSRTATPRLKELLGI